MLLEKGADRTLADNDGDTAVSYYVPKAPTEKAAQLRALLEEHVGKLPDLPSWAQPSR